MTAEYPWLDEPSPTVGDLKAGDVIFFKPADFTIAGPHDFRKFPLVAAYAQSFPYGSPRPWHHVAVCVEHDPIPKAIGFGVTGDAQHFGSQLNELDPFTIPGPDDGLVLEIDALRPPDALVNDLVSLWRNQLSTTYSVGGLLGFGLVSLARMMPIEPDQWWFHPEAQTISTRDHLLNIGWGADSIAQTIAAESCVSHVSKAVAALTNLRFATPPVPSNRPQIDSEQKSEVDGLLDALIERVGEEIVARPKSASHILYTDVYIEGLKTALDTVFARFGTERLVELGQRARVRHNDTPAPPSLLVSPAMLHQALYEAGFTRVGS